ncbi:unnamed protein product [Notodromas monacha]|uniref:Flightin n=1 Tax=Notodromas monacha TaxID=399045 RepID=A0A7R9GF58_9CRUS|nr:unnamed protein product [Notodromas monacha]CAG0920353.1 unnamed protein product [Notodromas monacha]
MVRRRGERHGMTASAPGMRHRRLQQVPSKHLLCGGSREEGKKHCRVKNVALDGDPWHGENPRRPKGGSVLSQELPSDLCRARTFVEPVECTHCSLLLFVSKTCNLKAFVVPLAVVQYTNAAAQYPEAAMWENHPSGLRSNISLASLPKCRGGFQYPSELREGTTPEAATVVPGAADLELQLDSGSRRRSKYNVHWKRPKSHLYEYNFDYGSNYYKSMINYIDERNKYGSNPEVPKPQSWEERALKSYLERAKREKELKGNTYDAQLMTSIRRSSSMYFQHTKNYARRLTTRINVDALL